MIKVTDEIREAARGLLPNRRHNKADAAILEAIATGKRKRIDWNWWSGCFAASNRSKLDKIAALADPERNNREHERLVAAAKLKAAKARRPPGMKPEPPPIPTNLSGWTRRGRKTKTAPAPQPSRRLSDSVASAHTSDSVARLKSLNERRAAQRAAKRAGLKCQSCGKPLAALRPTARYCNATCRSQAWRGFRR